MQYAAPSCQLQHAQTGDSSRKGPSLEDGGTLLQTALVRGTEQELAHTKSRRSGPRRWLRAVQWLIAAGIHPRANATTLRVAEDLATRMDYDTGHARYCLDDTAARLGVSTATVKRHVKVLRELGALAWAVHGTRTNIRRARGLGGYAGTATVYAAVIPPVYDHAMGHRIVGSGYEARIVIDQRGQQTPVDNPPVDNTGSEDGEPPSLTWVEEEGKLKVVGGWNYIPRQGAARLNTSPTPTPKSSSRKAGLKGTTGRSALRVLEDIRIARQVRPLVQWTQREGLRRLAYALRPLIDRGLDAQAIAGELTGMCLGWRPAAPAAYIQAALAAQETAQREHAEVVARYERLNPAEGAFTASARQVYDIAAGLREGLARYQADMKAKGHDDLSHGAIVEFDAAADLAAFLGSSA